MFSINKSNQKNVTESLFDRGATAIVHSTKVEKKSHVIEYPAQKANRVVQNHQINQQIKKTAESFINNALNYVYK